jgi:hypothetical protein
MDNIKTKAKITFIAEAKDSKNGKWLTFRATTIGASYEQKIEVNYFKKAEYVKFIDKFATDYPIGTEVDLELSIMTNEYDGKIYTNLSLWKIDKIESTPSDPEPIVGNDSPF